MSDTVLVTHPLGFQWPTADPFLFCVHHDDAYPPANEQMGPAASLAGRNLGMDFEGKDGWRMYHGQIVPGFPQHPHRGFETVTIVRRGYIDHSDSLGAAARYGRGDVQWLTAGGGIVHSEMFPLIDRDKPNPLELFQIWLNLPKTDKLVDPYFTMFWHEAIPRRSFTDESGRKTEVTVIAGQLDDAAPLAPPPSSWASHDDADVAIWCLRMDPGAVWTMPPAKPGSGRTLYFFAGPSMNIAERSVNKHVAATLQGNVPVRLEAGDGECELLLLQARPIKEPIVQYGPFVMNSRAEIQQAVIDYRKTGYGGWPWPSDDPVHAREEGRFARHADGRIERADG